MGGFFFSLTCRRSGEYRRVAPAEIRRIAPPSFLSGAACS